MGRAQKPTRAPASTCASEAAIVYPERGAGRRCQGSSSEPRHAIHTRGRSAFARGERGRFLDGSALVGDGDDARGGLGGGEAVDGELSKLGPVRRKCLTALDHLT